MIRIILQDGSLDLCGTMRVGIDFPSDISFSEMYKAIYLELKRLNSKE